MKRQTIRCTECNHNPSRLFDLIFSEDGRIYVETKCKKDGIVTVDITEEICNALTAGSNKLKITA